MSTLISDKYTAWKQECETRFQQLKSNEEALNRIFIDIYGLQDELTPEVAGIVISADGGGNASVRAEISEAMEALFGLPAHKIKVLKRVKEGV